LDHCLRVEHCYRDFSEIVEIFGRQALKIAVKKNE